jgi:hypothetical protein
MLDLRRPLAAALLVGATMVPALAATPASAAGSVCGTDPAAAAGWTYVATYTDCATCEAAGPSMANTVGAASWQCVPSIQPGALPGSYDLYVL